MANTTSTAKIKVEIVNEAQVIRSLNNLDGIVAALNRKQIKFDIDYKDVPKASKNIDDLSKNVGGLEKKEQGAVKESGKLNKALSFVGKNISTKLVTGAINAVVNSFKAAYTEIAAVDGELAKIQRDSGATAGEMKLLGNSAYDAAQKYGVSTAEYLQNVGVFTKANYGDAAQGMAELSLQTQLIGDMSAETASRFLMAADGAFGLKQNTDELSKVLEKANNIDNAYAVSLESIAAGMPLVSDTAAAAGMSIEETMAMLATITEATGQTGEAAAATAQELITGIVESTSGEMNGLTEVLQNYAGEALAAAEASGGMVNPIEALSGLAEAAQQGLLSEADLAQISASIGGNLDNAQIGALLGQFASIGQMIDTMGATTRSVGAEMAAAVDTLDAKTQNLKTAWAGLVETMGLKGLAADAKDSLAGMLNGLNDLLTSPHDKAQQTKAELEQEYNTIDGMISQYKALENSANGLTEAERQRYELLKNQAAMLKEEQTQAANDEYEAWQKQYGTGNVIDSGVFSGNYITGDQVMLSDFGSDLSHANANLTESSDFTAYQAELDSVISKYAEMYDSLVRFNDMEGVTLSDSQEQFIGLYESMAGITNELANGGELFQTFWQAAHNSALAGGVTESEAINAADEALRAYAEQLDQISEEKTTDVEADTEDAEGKVSALQAALDKLASIYTADIVINQVGNVPSFGKFSGTRAAANGTKSAPGGLTLVNERGPELISANGTAYIAGGGEPTITDLPRGATVLTARQTKQALGGADPRGLYSAFQSGTNAAAAEAAIREMHTRLGTTGAYKTAQQEKFNEQRYRRSTNTAAQSTPPSTANWYAPAAAASAPAPEPPDFEALEKDLKETLKNLNLQAELAENQGRTNELLEIYGRAQSSIQGLLDKYLQNGYDADSTEVLTLTNSGYDYGRKQLKAYDSLKDELVDALNALTNATRDAEALEEKQLAVDKARQSLQNAENQRTVRIFNAESGQWEWVANAAEIERAQENLQRAEKALAQEQIQRDIEAIKNAEGDEILQVNFSTAMRELMRSGGAERLAELVRSAGGTVAAVDFMNTPGYETQFNRPAETNIGSQYYLDGITITENQASTMTLKDLTDQLRILKLTS